MGYPEDKAREYVRTVNRSLEVLIREVIDDCANAARIAIHLERLKDPVKDSEGDAAYANALVDAERAVALHLDTLKER